MYSELFTGAVKSYCYLLFCKTYVLYIYIYKMYLFHCSSIPVTETQTINWIFYFEWRETWKNWLFPVKLEPINSEQANWHHLKCKFE